MHGMDIEIWFEFGSPYSYPSVMRIEKAAAREGLRVAWRPFLLDPARKALGGQSSPFLRQKQTMLYVWGNLERQCARDELPWRRPGVFPRSALLPMRVATLGMEQPWIGGFCRAVMRQHLVDDLDIDAPAQVARALRGLGLPAEELIERAGQEGVKAQLRRQIEQARERGIFGGPTFFVRGAMFWGNDRLGDALLHAASLRERLAA